MSRSCHQVGKYGSLRMELDILWTTIQEQPPFKTQDLELLKGTFKSQLISLNN